MGGVITPTTYRKAETQVELMQRFARIMRQRYGATLYLFGSRARGTAGPDSDYDIVAISESSRGQKRTARVLDRFYLWLEAGGWGESLDLHCYTPEEFRKQTRYGDGFLGHAKKQGEITVIRVSRDTAP
ncbi:MAG: nucleotidyltransferase domain-containing protein [Chloroflexi bacterium]|nr:nucleotidyltransferase domain-containing protein [Chloroflexota bacterium]